MKLKIDQKGLGLKLSRKNQLDKMLNKNPLLKETNTKRNDLFKKKINQYNKIAVI